MNDHNHILWQTKLAARLHDPAEKALVLLRDPAGHEEGTSRALARLLGLSEIAAENIDPDNEEVLSRVMFKHSLPRAIYRHVQRADWWAAAADRPQWPMQEITVTSKTGEQKTLKVADWAQVRWTRQPVLIHPLTGEQYELPGGLTETDIADIKQRSFDHFSRLRVAVGVRDETSQDPRKMLLAFWRFGPDLVEDEDFGKLGALWKLLPADTRVPDHSIWDHLDLTSAFAGAFAADPDGHAALLTFSIGPVQSFIAAARKTEDLWAGSHLLSRLSWEAMRIVCERLGPDAILFPRLRGVAQVDLWLRDEVGLPRDWFDHEPWTERATDANPLFAAALPNRFVAVVPARQAQDIAKKVTQAVRDWLLALGLRVVDRLLEEAGFKEKSSPRDEGVPAYAQVHEQLRGLPEAHWAVVPFSLIRPRNEAKQTDLDLGALSSAIAPFSGVARDQACGFLASPAWNVLQRSAELGGAVFYAPNPGVLYPAVYDLGERVLAAAKAVRPFEQTAQEGWRESLTGESEWLTTDRDQLETSYRQRTDTLWSAIARRKPAWAKKARAPHGPREHLGALSAIKRLWPTLFAEEVGGALGQPAADRFVVSTHTMALAYQLEKWLLAGAPLGEEMHDKLRGAFPVALPRRLSLRFGGRAQFDLAKRIPGYLDDARETDDEDEAVFARARKDVQALFKQAFGTDDEPRLETYYALLMMDGDHMGRILSGDERTAITYIESFHPEVRDGFKRRAPGQSLIEAYGEQKRALSPNRHLAISGALNEFSQTVVRHVVEEEHLGRVMYAGGDDVLAMLPVADLLSAMKRLRQAYSGTVPEDENVDWSELRKRKTLVCKSGFAYLNRRLMRMMGKNATASCGAVIGHHQAPLAMVLRELRAAERRGKTDGGRDAFSLTVIKRSGGALVLTAKWGEPLRLLTDLCDFLADPDVSRRAVYHCVEWLADVPMNDQVMLGALLGYQFDRQAKPAAKQRHDVAELARRLASLAFDPAFVRQAEDRRMDLANFLTVAEFLAREGRGAGGDELGARPKQEAARGG